MSRHNHDPGAYSHSGQINLKPMPQAKTYLYNPTTTMGMGSNKAYKPLASHADNKHRNDPSTAADDRLKQRIRALRLVSRVVALLISIATLIPQTMTLTKFLSTRNEYFTVDGKQRTAWAKDSITWYTYMYFSVSFVSFVFDLTVVVSYWRGVRRANRVASFAQWWVAFVIVSHVVVWIVSVAIYRYGREPVDGKFRDLWGWTCSPTAQAIQDQIPNVDFGQYCTVQTASFYTGLANVAAGVLSTVILLMAALRMRSKKRAQKMRAGSQPEF